ncbi:MAG: MarR family transcriptional regulator [Acidimicrobiales bacterium]
MATRWLSDDEREAWKHLNLMQLQLNALLGRELADDGLSYQDYLVLAGLSDAPDNRVRLTELGCQLGWEKSRVSHHVSRMEQRGLVAKVKCPTDRRGSFVVLTDEGRRAIAAAAPGHVDTVRRHFIDLLTPEQISTLDDIARTVLDHLPKR